MNSKINIPKVFFSFLIASFLMWVLINLSKEYSTLVTYKVVYEKLPQNKILQEVPLEEIDLEVKGTGFKLFTTSFSNRSIILYADKLQKSTKSYYWFLPKKQEIRIQKQLHSGLKLEKVVQDTLFFKLGSLASKKVPVLTRFSIDFKHGYNLSAPITVIPDSVLISGAALQLEKIKSVFTQKKSLQNVFENQEQELSIENPLGFEKVKISHTKVQTKITVDKFTEGTFSVPFTVKNVPYGTIINTYPKKVKIVFKVGLNNFSKITSNSFKVVCDYRESKENELPYLVAKLEMSSNLTSSVKIVPDKIDFLIQK